MNKAAGTFILALLVAAFLLGTPTRGRAHILRVEDGHYVSLAEMLDDLKGVQLVFMGELHDHAGHHRAQLQVINGLKDMGVPVAVGLEMFRQESQWALDRWVAGTMPVGEFLRIYSDNWSRWSVYREIFFTSRRKKIPMVGLNISREITRKVARNGFASLTPEQAGQIPGVRCDVDEKYRNYIRRVLGGHGGDDESFIHFCEAQMLWDSAMARALLDFLAANPNYTVVVLTGSGHAWKYGIPEQVKRQKEVPYRVLLPEIRGRIEAGDATPAEADYLMLGLDEAPLH